jgi:signal transduction histidine kinase
MLDMGTGIAGKLDMGLLPGDRRAVQQIRVLLVEDEPLYAKLVLRRLTDTQVVDIRPVHVASLGEALGHLSMGMTDLIVLDLMLPDSAGIETLASVREAAPLVPVVVLTGQGADELAVDAIQLGAQDYLVKGTDEGLMVRSLRYALERSRAWDALQKSEATLRSTRMQLLQIDKLDSVGRLAAGIAHEVRNPLSTIQMGISFLRNYCPNQSEEALETLDDMDSAMERAYDIIKGVLDFCLPTQLNLEDCSLNRCICQIMPMVSHEIKRHGIVFTPDLAGDLPTLRLDPNQIKQVLLHLILNAIDAVEEKGMLRVQTRVCRASEAGDDVPRSTAGRSVCLSIDDDGCGIPADVMGKIFEPFFTTKPTGKGTGLGLSISRNIIELHGGRLAIVNRPEGGVRATIHFAA